MELDNDTKKSVKHDFMFGEKKNSENLFVERWYQLLRENGRLAAVLPESVFDTTENKYIRLFLYKYFTIKAVISLPQISFEPYTSTKTSILFAQKKTAAEVKAWNDAWDSASKEYSHLVTQAKNLIAVANGTKQKARLPSIKNLTAEQERKVLARMLKNYLTELDDELDANTLIKKYTEELESICTIDKDTKDTLGFVNTWWVFGEVASKLNYSLFVAEAENIGYKRTKRGEKAMPNDHYRVDASGDILIDGLFNDMRLQDARLGETVADRTDMIGLFASDAGKKGGEFFTPAGPSRLCATLASLGLDEAKTVGDCTCGSASMLLEVQKHLTTHKVGHFYGQELNATTYNLSRMNMIMHGVDWQNFDIYKGDTLKDDKYGDDLKLTVQVCNPPYSLKWSADKKFQDDPRYSGAGKLAPKGQADLAFVEHMIYHMDDSDGRVAVLLPHGVLFRGGAEEAIRKYIIRDLNRLDAVIGLPANLFHGTGISVCVLVLKSKRNDNSGNILFIDASKEFKSGKNQNVLEQEHIDKIVDAYAKREDVDKFAHVADMREIIENGYNLNIPRYVDTFEEEEPVDLDAVKAQIKTLDSETKAAIDKAESFMRQLGL